MITIRQYLLSETGLTPPIFASLRDLCGLAVNSFHLVTCLPSIEEIEAELERSGDEEAWPLNLKELKM